MNKQQVRRDYSLLIEQLLAGYGVWKAGEDRWRSACPVHKGDNVTTFSIFGNGRWKCHKCGAWGDMARLIVAVRRLTLKQAQEYLGSAPVPFRHMAEIPQLAPKLERKAKLPYTVMREAIIAPFRRHCPRYLTGRGFSEEALSHYEVGYDLDSAKIVVPVRDWKSRLVGLTYRLDFDSDRSQPAKYWHDNFMKSWHLYGFQLWAKRKLRRLYLVEGQLDVVRMYQLGYAAAGIMGSEISKEQVDILVEHSQAESLVLAFDNDEAGYKARKGAIQKLSKTRFSRNLLVWNYPTNDPGELNGTQATSTAPWHTTLGQH